jgi:hypothetical protein
MEVIEGESQHQDALGKQLRDRRRERERDGVQEESHATATVWAKLDGRDSMRASTRASRK